MIEILEQKFEEDDLVEIEHKKGFKVVGYIHNKDWLDKIFKLISISCRNKSKLGLISYRNINILKIKKLEVKNG